MFMFIFSFLWREFFVRSFEERNKERERERRGHTNYNYYNHYCVSSSYFEMSRSIPFSCSNLVFHSFAVSHSLILLLSSSFLFFREIINHSNQTTLRSVAALHSWILVSTVWLLRGPHGQCRVGFELAAHAQKATDLLTLTVVRRGWQPDSSVNQHSKCVRMKLAEYK